MIFVFIFALDNYDRITPTRFTAFGFGYSLSNIGEGKNENGKPYFATSAININLQHNDSKVFLYNSPPLCINVREHCRSKAVIKPSVLSESAKGET